MSISSFRSYSLEASDRPDLELAAESKRILYVLDKAISRAKFVGVLKSFVADDGYLLNDILDSDDHFVMVQISRKYEFTGVKYPERRDSFDSVEQISLLKSSSTSVKSSPTKDDLLDDVDSESVQTEHRDKAKALKLQSRVDNELSKVILMLEEYPEVHRLAAKIENEISPQMRFFIRCLQELRNEVAYHLGESAAQEKSREAYLRKCYDKNEKAKKEIERLEKALLEHKADANYCIIGRNVLINRHQNKINRIKKASQEAIEKRVKESEKAMANDWKASLSVQETLKEELQNTTKKYEQKLKENLVIEKNLRIKRNKVENQLIGWLQKFDQDIGEKQAEEEAIQELLDNQNKELENIRLKLEEQEEEYDELMQEKAEYELEMLEQRLYVFILHRSARRIQRYYRVYKAKKLAKKKGKKDKKGKKGGK